MSSCQPEFVELPILHSDSLALSERFEPSVVIRVGKIELELSNTVSGSLMQQLKGLIGFAE